MVIAELKADARRPKLQNVILLIALIGNIIAFPNGVVIFLLFGAIYYLAMNSGRS